MGKQKADYLLRSDHIFTSTVETHLQDMLQ